MTTNTAWSTRTSPLKNGYADVQDHPPEWLREAYPLASRQPER